MQANPVTKLARALPALLVATALAFLLPAGLAASSSGTYAVLADGSVTYVSLTTGSYEVTVSGTYVFGLESDVSTPRTADADYSWSWTEGPCYDFPSNNHDLLMDGVSPWSQGCDAATHTYRTTYECSASSCTVAFWITDDQYSDNSGELTVTITGGIGGPTCFAYNPAALTNLCVGPSEETTYVPVPSVYTTPTPVCILGPICPAVPVPGVDTGSSTPVAYPTVEGYAEATVVCSLHVPCRATLP